MSGHYRAGLLLASAIGVGLCTLYCHQKALGLLSPTNHRSTRRPAFHLSATPSTQLHPTTSLHLGGYKLLPRFFLLLSTEISRVFLSRLSTMPSSF